MNAPDPKANTTTEAYLAYKAGYLEESELKPVLYKPDWHFDGWLAYWAGLVNTYPTKENGDPEMLCDEEALVAYLSGVTDTYPEEIKDPYDVRIVGYLRHLASIRWPEPDYPVNNEEFYLSTMDPTHTSNPVPSSDIELDTAEGKIISVEAYGDTYQQTYSGKNLLPYPYADGDSKTTRGITYTVNADGTVTLNGQNDGTANSAYFFVDRWGSMPMFELSAGTYYFIPNSEDVEYEMYDGSHYYTLSSNNSFTVTFQSSVSIRQVYIVIRKTNQTQFNNYKLYPMFTTTANPTVADYEPYTNGPAPNPDYPQAVNVVAGEQNVWVHGKNLLDPTNLTYVYANSPSQIVLSTIPDGIRMVNNGGVSQGRFAVFKSVDLTEYVGKTIKMKAIFGAGGGIRLYRIKSDGTGRMSMASTTVSNTEISFNVPQDLGESNYLGYALDNTIGSGNVVDFTNLIMTIDDSIDPYVPYQGATYTVDLGATELCKIGNYQDYIYKSGDDWYVHKATGSLLANGSEDWTYGSNKRANLIIPGALRGSSTNIPIKSNRYIARWTSDTDGSVFLSGTYDGIGVIDEAHANPISSWKTWLASNNTTFYYALATPTDTKITDATLVGQLEALAGADTYNEKTYIKVTATDPNLPALLKVEAYKY